MTINNTNNNNGSFSSMVSSAVLLCPMIMAMMKFSNAAKTSSSSVAVNNFNRAQQQQQMLRFRRPPTRHNLLHQERILQSDEWIQLGDDIDGKETEDNFGASVAISRDGQIFVAGSTGHNEKTGQAIAYEWHSEDGIWKQLGNPMEGAETGDRFGHSVAISPNGQRIAVGALQAGFDSRGTITVFSWNDDVQDWNPVGKEPYLAFRARSRLGETLAMSDDGSIAIASALGYSSSSGSASPYVLAIRYNETANIWDRLGRSVFTGDFPVVALSSSGNRFAVGSSIEESVKVYDLEEHPTGNNEESKWQLSGIIENSSDENEFFGQSVSFALDGMRLAVGSSRANDSGNVRVFNYSEEDEKWFQYGRSIPGENVGDSFGWAVSMSEDGTKVAAGSWSNDDAGEKAGHVRVFQITPDTDWEQIGSDIDGESANDQSGGNMALSGNGKIVAIGGRSDENGEDSGHVRVFGFGDEAVPPSPDDKEEEEDGGGGGGQDQSGDGQEEEEDGGGGQEGGGDGDESDVVSGSIPRGVSVWVGVFATFGLGLLWM